MTATQACRLKTDYHGDIPRLLAALARATDGAKDDEAFRQARKAFAKTLVKPEERKIVGAVEAFCWYTGLPCFVENPGFKKAQFRDHRLTRDHLVARARFALHPGLDHQSNRVKAVQYVNSMLGDAPLNVKLEFRRRAREALGEAMLLTGRMRDRLIALRDTIFAEWAVGPVPAWVVGRTRLSTRLSTVEADWQMALMAHLLEAERALIGAGLAAVKAA